MRVVLFLLVFVPFFSFAQSSIKIDNKEIKLFPFEYDENPDIKSPLEFDGREYILAKTSISKFTVIDVTVENGKPYNYRGKVRGKGNQLYVNSIDFPTLAKTGLHSETELQNIKSITGRSIWLQQWIFPVADRQSRHFHR